VIAAWRCTCFDQIRVSLYIIPILIRLLIQGLERDVDATQQRHLRA
jgi:hypothetical protein